MAGIAAFVGMMFEIAPSFDEQPGIAGALLDPAIDPNQRNDAEPKPNWKQMTRDKSAAGDETQ